MPPGSAARHPTHPRTPGRSRADRPRPVKPRPLDRPDPARTPTGWPTVTGRTARPWRGPPHARTLTTTPATRGHGMASKTPANRATAPRHERPARPKARHSTGKLQARQAPPASGVRPESGTPVRKIGHKTHTGTIQLPHGERPNIRITVVTCLYGHCTATVRPSRNHLTNVVLAAEPVVIHPGRMRDADVERRRAACGGALAGHWCEPFWVGGARLPVSHPVARSLRALPGRLQGRRWLRFRYRPTGTPGPR